MASMQELYKLLREGDATKSEEVEILHKLSTAAFESDSYLKHLLTPDLVGWVRARLQGDILPDLMGELKAARSEAREESDRADEAIEDACRWEIGLDNLRTEQVAGDEKYAQDMASKVKEIVEMRARHNETIEQLLLAERQLRAIRKLAGDAYLDERDVTADEIKATLKTQPPQFPEWASTNPHHYDEV